MPLLCFLEEKIYPSTYDFGGITLNLKKKILPRWYRLFSLGAIWIRDIVFIIYVEGRH